MKNKSEISMRGAVPLTRGTQARMIGLARMLCTTKWVTAVAIAKANEVSAKTVYRDLETAQDRLGWPIETKPHNRFSAGGYRLSKPLILCDCCLAQTR
jgi:hypothetical protein